MSDVSRKPRVYVAGPMRHNPHFNFPEFDRVRDRLSEHGWDVVSPADLDRAFGFDAMTLPEDTDWSKLPDGMDMFDIMARDLDALETCDAIYMMRGWEKSDGANKEYERATKWGLRAFYQDRNNVGEDHYPSAKCMMPVESAPAVPRPATVDDSEEEFRAHVKSHKAEICGETRITDPLTGGQKGAKPAMFDQIPSGPLWELATLYGYGARKYSPNNWCKGYSWRLSFAACMRHLWAFWRGEDIDPESGMKHVIHAAWHCFAMAWFMDHRRSHDDRYVDKTETPA